MKEIIEQLKESHIRNVEMMIDVFCQKHDFTLEHQIGYEVFTFGDRTFNLFDIEYDLFNNLPENEIIEWWDYSYQWSLLDPNHRINLHSWHHGCPRRSEEMYKRIAELHGNIIKAEEEMKSELKKL